MKPKIIKREGFPKELTLAPDHEQGIFTSIVLTQDGKEARDQVGRGILVSNVSDKIIEKIEQDPNEVNLIVQPHNIKLGAFVLQHGLSGRVFEMINRHDELIDSHEMAVRTFVEYSPVNPTK